MPSRPLSIGELAVHFGLEPVDVEWMIYSYAHGVLSWPELIAQLQALDCPRREAERLAAHVHASARPNDVSRRSWSLAEQP